MAQLPFRVDLAEVIDLVSKLALVARAAEDPAVDQACDHLVRLLVPRHRAALA